MKISLELNVSSTKLNLDVSLDEIGVTAEQWEELKPNERIALLELVVDAENDTNRPYWTLFNYTFED